MFSSELFKSLEIADKLDDVPKVRADHYEALTGEDAHYEALTEEKTCEETMKAKILTPAKNLDGLVVEKFS